MNFNGPVDGDYGLTVNSSGNEAFGTVGGTIALASLAAGTGTVTLGGNITTANGTVTINGNTALAADVTVNTGTGAVSFAAIDGAYGLTIDGSGTTAFGGTVGLTANLTSLTTGTGLTQLSGNVDTTGAQNYRGAVQLLGPLVMEAGGGNITFAGTLNSSASPVRL